MKENSYYDPDDVGIRVEHIIAEEYLEKIKSGALLYSKGSIWSQTKKESFIESLFINLPIAHLVIDGSCSKWKIIDGNQRFMAIADFIDGKFQVNNKKFLKKELNGKRYDELSYWRYRVIHAKLIAYVFNPPYKKHIIENLIQRYAN